MFATDFSEASYMNPQQGDQRYKDRDKKVGQREAEKRKAHFPLIDKTATELAKKYGFRKPKILIKGSTAVAMCTPKSDLDIAVLVGPSHPLATNLILWRDFRTSLDTCYPTDFKIESRLVLTSGKEAQWKKEKSSSVLLITGTCASGKTTLGKLLADKYGYIHIDGDEVWKEVKAQRGKQVGWNDIHQDILTHTTQFVDLSKIVITHVIFPELLPIYQAFYAQRNLQLIVIVLMPKNEVIYSRNQLRKCWPVPTAQKDIDDINKKLKSDLYLSYYLDTSDQSPGESVAAILALLK
jgi:gluconate kinase